MYSNHGGNHWIMVSSIGCSRNTVKICDSLNLRLSSTIVNVNVEFLHASNDFFTIEYARMQCQTGSDDCGLFAIASACALCNGHDHSLAKFDQPEMRPHLRNVFETKSIVKMI